MACIGILERGHSFSDSVGEAFASCGIQTHDILPVSEGKSYDAVIISTNPPEHICPCNANILITPDCIGAKNISSLTSKSVVSYGLCKKNTLTVSSLIGTRLVVSLQCDITTMQNGTVGEQEFCIDIEHADGIDNFLGIVAALLVSDISPETISRAVFDF